METEVSREMVTAADVCFVRHMIKFLAFFFLFVFLRASVTAVVYSSLEKSLSSACIGRLSCSCLSTLLHSSEVATGGLSEKALILEENKVINIFFNSIPAKDKANVKEEQLKQYKKI